MGNDFNDPLRNRYLFGYVTIVIGVVLALVSFIAEAQVFSIIAGTTSVVIAVVALEGAKIVSIIVRRASDLGIIRLHSNSEKWNDIFRIVLVVISFLSTAILIGGMMDRPQIESVRAKDKDVANGQFDMQVHDIEKQSMVKVSDSKSKENVEEEYTDELLKVEMQFVPQMQTLERGIELERNKFGKKRVYQGMMFNQLSSEYAQINARLQNEKARLKMLRDKELKMIALDNSEMENDRSLAVQFVEKNRQKKLLAIDQASYSDDPRVRNSLVQTTLRLVEQFELKVNAEKLAIFFGALISIALELGIIVTSESAVSIFEPAFR